MDNGQFPIKESSDELNAPVVTSAFITRPQRKRTTVDYFALALATCGVGYMPVAPGTWGSAVGVGLYLLWRAASEKLLASGAAGGLKVTSDLFHLLFTSSLLLIIIIISLAGIWAATRAERLLGRKDPGAVVVDEVAGQLITFLFIPFQSPLWVIVTGFFVFRAFDIIKPYPVRRLEALASGLGIMADDVLAGFYAAALMAWLTTIYLMF